MTNMSILHLIGRLKRSWITFCPHCQRFNPECGSISMCHVSSQWRKMTVTGSLLNKDTKVSFHCSKFFLTLRVHVELWGWSTTRRDHQTAVVTDDSIQQINTNVCKRAAADQPVLWKMMSSFTNLWNWRDAKVTNETVLNWVDLLLSYEHTRWTLWLIYQSDARLWVKISVNVSRVCWSVFGVNTSGTCRHQNWSESGHVSSCLLPQKKKKRMRQIDGMFEELHEILS